MPPSTISPKIWLAYIQNIKNKLKSDPVIQDICKKYDMDPEELDLVPIKFGNIDTSATTDRGVITLNWKLLEPKNRHQIPGYICHEFNHFCQQSSEPTQSADDGDYLKNPYEQEAFQQQIRFLDNHFGEEAAENYTDQVLDHHEEKGKERKEKKEILMKKVK